MPRRELLQLAKTYEPHRHHVAGFYISDKLDGTRCLWDGGISRGRPTESIPYASLADPKSGKRKAKIKPTATGLWSRYGNPIMAPEWFLNQLPCCPLDGELWAGEGNFQLCRSICAGDEPDPRFDQIQFAVYSSPPLERLFQLGEIKNSNMVCQIDVGTQSWVRDRIQEFGADFRSSKAATFEEELMFLNDAIETQSDHIYLHRQTKLPADEEGARRAIDSYMEGVLAKGGEGVILRDHLMPWTPKRNAGILKYKPFLDADGILVGFTSGRETNKGSRLQGKIGALIVDFEGKRLELAGLTDEERQFSTGKEALFASQHPGVDMPSDFQSRLFELGQRVSFKYRELTDDNIPPKEARYWRVRGGE